MRTVVRFRLLILCSVAALGLTLGYSLPGLSQIDFVTVAALLVLAGFGEWLLVKVGPIGAFGLGPTGAFTLGPAIAFPALWASGLAPYVAVAVLPGVFAELAVRRSTPRRAAAALPPRLVAVWCGYIGYALSREVGIFGSDPVGLTDIGSRVLGVVSFWTAMIAMQGVVLSLSEGIRLRAAVRQLAQYAWRHIAVLTAAAVALGYVWERFDLWVLALSVVMLMELYYPWRLLGEQDGVLLTSLQMMAQAVDLKDPYTSNHSQRVAEYATRVARVLDLPESQVGRVRIGGLMHDIGKIGVSGRIIRKPGKLTAEEEAMMREHSTISARIIENLEILGDAADMVRHHHERWDGRGYPDGLRREEIPVEARLIFVADAFDALTTDRPYRKGFSHRQGVDEILRNAGTQFDPAAARALEQVVANL